MYVCKIKTIRVKSSKYADKHSGILECSSKWDICVNNPITQSVVVDWLKQKTPCSTKHSGIHIWIIVFLKALTGNIQYQYR